ncbi:Subtilisin-like protease SBT5.3 [Vitis vinifera]|uniref:Subtilisin-like protease SBT5.3 n=1 Tax=Vitis vinifera TaxID=29760 RepID=A0A438EEH1_VITVI|nr:Subtilisin-like protease SBT5.3 [Vitis vinifera]
MRLSGPALCLLSFLLISLLLSPTFAIERVSTYHFCFPHKRFIHSVFGSTLTWPEPSSDDLDQVTESHYEFLGSFLGSRDNAKEAIIYSYTRHINGFAATLQDHEAAQIANHPKVVSVFLNKGRKLHTTRSWHFLGLENDGIIPSNSIWKKARFGQDTIIGNLDTGEFYISFPFWSFPFSLNLSSQIYAKSTPSLDEYS